MLFGLPLAMQSLTSVPFTEKRRTGAKIERRHVAVPPLGYSTWLFGHGARDRIGLVESRAVDCLDAVDVAELE